MLGVASVCVLRSGIHDLLLADIGWHGQASVATVTAMASTTVEKMHQWTSQQQKVNPIARNMIPVLTHQEEPTDQGDHQ